MYGADAGGAAEPLVSDPNMSLRVLATNEGLRTRKLLGSNPDNEDNVAVEIATSKAVRLRANLSAANIGVPRTCDATGCK